MCAKVTMTTNKKKNTKHPIPASAKKKKPPKKKKAVTTTDDREKKRSMSLSPEDLLLVARVFMKVGSNAKHGTDKKMEKFWEEIHLHYNELVTTSNKINESNMENIPVKSHNMESLRNC